MGWARHAGAVDAATAERLRAEVETTVFRHVRQLREAIYGVGSALASGGVGPAADLKTLKEFAASAAAPAELAPQPGGGYGLDFSAAPVEGALFGPIAWSALNLLAAGGFERLKQCPGHDCGWLFIDTSKNNSRRWCDMATCGNRTKGRRHRERQ